MKESCNNTPSSCLLLALQSNLSNGFWHGTCLRKSHERGRLNQKRGEGCPPQLPVFRFSLTRFLGAFLTASLGQYHPICWCWGALYSPIFQGSAEEQPRPCHLLREGWPPWEPGRKPEWSAVCGCWMKRKSHAGVLDGENFATYTRCCLTSSQGGKHCLLGWRWRKLGTGLQAFPWGSMLHPIFQAQENFLDATVFTFVLLTAVFCISSCFQRVLMLMES